MRKPTAVSIAILLLFAASPAFADAAATFKSKCAMCHGADGRKVNKATNVRDLTSAEVQKQSDQELLEITANGRAKMPAYKGKLSDEEIKGLVKFIRELPRK